MTRVTPAFDETIHAPLRLKACVALASVQRMAFGALRDDLDVADSVLSKHLKTLADAGYVALDRPTGQGGRPRTWVSLTRAGHLALAGHLAALEEMVAATRSAPPVG